MDCNKEDAIKAQQIAERKMVSEDYDGAKRFILKAQRLYPDLGGVAQMLAVVDVHITATDIACDDLSGSWYQILKVDRQDDENTIRRQYRKLQLLLHPDKNKYKGAASAFDLVKSAWECFEEEKKLAIFIASNAISEDHFWTVCPFCKKPSKKEKSLEHQYVQCTDCLTPFMAVEFPHRKQSYKGDCHQDAQQREAKEQTTGDPSKVEQKVSDNDESMQEISCEKFYASDSSSSEEAGKKRKNDGKGKSKAPKRSRGRFAEEQSTSSRRTRKSKVAFVSDSDTDPSNGHPIHEGNVGNVSHDNGYLHDVKVEIGDCSHYQEQCNGKEVEKESQKMQGKLFDRLKLTLLREFSGAEFQAVDITEDTLSADSCSSSQTIQLKVAVSFTLAADKPCPATSHAHASVSENCGSKVWEEDQQNLQCRVPDNDVYNFDTGRQEENFEAGQVWAIYDDDDALPRFYAQILEVVSVHPFHVRMNWLFPAKSISKDVRDWYKAGYAYTCGEFKVGGKALGRKSVDMFSHIMAHESGPLPLHFRIYPQKSDVWALYKIWRPHKKGETRVLELVEVISDYTEELGIEVATLSRLNGYRSVFCREETKGTWFIPRLELTRFSHQVPAHYFIGDEKKGMPRSCIDLDLAAIA